MKSYFGYLYNDDFMQNHLFEIPCLNNEATIWGLYTC